MRKDNFNIIQDYPLSCFLEKIQEVVDPFPLGGNKKGGNSIKKASPNLVKLI
jgi:hypothetical protein